MTLRAVPDPRPDQNSETVSKHLLLVQYQLVLARFRRVRFPLLAIDLDKHIGVEAVHVLLLATGCLVLVNQASLKEFELFFGILCLLVTAYLLRWKRQVLWHIGLGLGRKQTFRACLQDRGLLGWICDDVAGLCLNLYHLT